MQKLAELCIERPVFATMLIFALTFIGAYAYNILGVDLFPKVDFPTITVTTTLRGASPEEVETEITKKIEEAVNPLPGIDELRSVSTEGVSQVFITFVLERNTDQAAQDVRDKINGVLKDLPKDIDPPIVEKLDPDATPVMSIAISAKRSSREITEIADKKIKQSIESISGVGQVRFIGDRKRQIQVWVDTTKLTAYNLTVAQVEAAITSQNLEIPGGRIDQGSREQVVRTLGRISDTSNFNKIIIANINNTPVRISDIGYIEDGIEEPRTMARLDGNEAIILEVRKQSGNNTLQVVDNVKERLAEIQILLPSDFKIQIIRDQSRFIKGSFEAIKEHLILGGFLAALVVLLFLRNFRSTIIAAIAIPTSIVSTFALMYYMNFTLNQMTMLALVLSVGIVIDDAIVVLENIYRFMEEKQMSAFQAAREATNEIGLAVMATTLSLIIIFLPVAFMGGIVGRFMQSFGLTAAFAIGVSLLVSFTLTPMMSARFLKVSHNSGHSAKQSFFYSLIERVYMAMLRFSMRFRLLVLVFSIIVIIATVPLFKKVGKDFITQDDTSDFQVDIRAPEGYSLSATAERLSQLEADIRTISGVTNLLTTIGGDSQRNPNSATIYVKIVDVTQRNYPQAEVMEKVRKLLVKNKDLRASVAYIASISSSAMKNADIQYSLRGPNLGQLAIYSQKITDYARTIPGVVDLDTSLISGKPEARIYIDRDRAADLGVKISDIATTIRTLIGGNDQVSNYREGEDRYDIQVRAQLNNRNTSNDILLLSVPSTKLGIVRLDQVVRVENSTGPAQIDRYNRQRQVVISGNIERGQSLGPVLDLINANVGKMGMSPEYQYGVQGRSRELGRAARNFLIAFVLSFAFMYMVLAAQFESFLDPITILLSLPLSIPFALLSLIIFDQTLNIFSALGILMLFGIVKKNSILQIDHANQLRSRGLSTYDAVIRACQDRLRPILMTTIALVAGMLPMALGQGPGAASRRSVAIIVIGGQSLCLLLTLLVTPVAYSLFDSLAKTLTWQNLTSKFSFLLKTKTQNN
ncbi:MAG: efflux RND transporter permease subunit [Acidobacteria bacterium]|nr:efflux RND transporter permease subunit [Acidobacteriota bacterium]